MSVALYQVICAGCGRSNCGREGERVYRGRCFGLAAKLPEIASPQATRPDGELSARAGLAEKAARRDLVNRVAALQWPKLLNACRGRAKLLGVSCESTREDIAQEAACRAWRYCRSRKFADGDAVRIALFGMARRNVLMLVTQRRRPLGSEAPRRRDALDGAIHRDAARLAWETSPDGSGEAPRLSLEDVSRRLDAIGADDDTRDLCGLLADGWTVSAAARRLELDRSTVYSRIAALRVLLS